MSTFTQMIESTSTLPLEDQEELVRTMQHRIAEQRRSELVAAVREARQEFATGKLQAASPAAIMKMIQE